MLPVFRSSEGSLCMEEGREMVSRWHFREHVRISLWGSAKEYHSWNRVQVHLALPLPSNDIDPLTYPLKSSVFLFVRKRIMILYGTFAQIKCSKTLNFMPSQEVRLHERMLITALKQNKKLATSHSIQYLSSSPTSPPLIWGNKNLCPEVEA